LQYFGYNIPGYHGQHSGKEKKNIFGRKNAMNADQHLIKVFEYALNQEKTGMNFFSNALSIMGVGEAITAFKILIAEEKKHIEFIQNILSDVTRKGEVEVSTIQAVTMDQTNFFSTRSESQFLQECVQGSMVPDITVFNTAWLIEKDLSEFYDRMAKKYQGKVRESLQMLADWEKGHERYFRAYRDRLSQLYSDMPWGG